MTISTLTRGKIKTVGAWQSIVGRGNGMETETEHNDDDDILGMPQYTRWSCLSVRVLAKGVCIYISFHFVFVFQVAGIAMLPLYRPHLLSTTREHERNHPTTTALATPNILGQVVEVTHLLNPGAAGGNEGRERAPPTTWTTTHPLTLHAMNHLSQAQCITVLPERPQDTSSLVWKYKRGPPTRHEQVTRNYFIGFYICAFYHSRRSELGNLLREEKWVDRAPFHLSSSINILLFSMPGLWQWSELGINHGRLVVHLWLSEDCFDGIFGDVHMHNEESRYISLLFLALFRVAGLIE